MPLRLSPATLVLTAGCIWAGAGLCLLLRGLHTAQTGLSPGLWMICIPAMIVPAWIKSRFILDPLAKKNISRLLGRSGRISLQRVFTGRAWLMTAAMILTARAVSSLQAPAWILAAVNVLVGLALLASSRLHLLAWIHDKKNNKMSKSPEHRQH